MLDKIDAFVLEEMQTWKVPGLALAIIQDGMVVHVAGYGWRDRDNRLPVTTQTLFPIASVTKSFTSAVLAILVGQGKLEWDKPVREYLPDFRLWDASATERATVRDLVTHRSGLPRHDWVWHDASLTREDLYQRLRYLEPSRDLRQCFQYNNLMYMTAGYLAGRIMNSTWEEITREFIFKPLRMKRAAISLAELEQADDYALPYEQDNMGMVQRGKFRSLDGVAPAGGISASIEELSNYLMMYLNAGRYEEQVVIPEYNIKEIQTPQVVVPEEVLYPELGYTQYGMGLYVSSYRGNKQIRHDGGLRGFASILSFLPEKKMGAVVLSNSYSSIPRIVTLRVFDYLLGLDPVPWSERAQSAQQSNAVTSSSNRLIPKQGTHPSHPLEEYIGEYQHPAYGTVVIRIMGTTLMIGYQNYTMPLNHFHYDIFETPPNKLSRLEKTRVRFETDWEGNIARLCIPFEAGIQDITFVRNL